jgi:hypothetical protein
MSEERLRRMDDNELGAALREAAPAWPSTPPLAAIVADDINRRERAPYPPRPRLSLPSRRRTVLVALAVLLALAAVAGAAKLVIDIGAVTVRTAPGTPSPGTSPSRAAFGDPVQSVRAAEASAGFAVTVPSALGAPDRVWVGTPFVQGPSSPPSARVTLAWDPRPGLPLIEDLRWGAVLMEFEGEVELASKAVFSGTGGFRPVRMDGRQAYWITGEHTLTVSAPDGIGTVETRVSGNVLLWQRGDRTLRLETSLGLGEAVDLVSPAG